MPVIDPESAKGLVDNWEKRNREVTGTMIETLKQYPKVFIQYELTRIDEHIEGEAKEPAQAFARLIRLVNFLNAAFSEDASLLDKLGEWLKKLVDKLRIIAEAWGTISFLVGTEARWPPSIYVEMGFEAGGGIGVEEK